VKKESVEPYLNKIVGIEISSNSGSTNYRTGKLVAVTDSELTLQFSDGRLLTVSLGFVVKLKERWLNGWRKSKNTST
jgi:hypothetical protein